MKEKNWEQRINEEMGNIALFPLHYFLTDAGTVFGRVRCDCTIAGNPAKLQDRVIVKISGLNK